MNNPPAFPSGNEVTLGDLRSSGHSGMTLRDYFAAKAMSGMMVDVEQPVCAYIAKQSYAMADAMLIQRNKS
jgi:hypothetical protein